MSFRRFVDKFREKMGGVTEEASSTSAPVAKEQEHKATKPARRPPSSAPSPSKPKTRPFIIRLTRQGALIKVNPSEDGKRISQKAVMEAINARGITDFNWAAVTDAIQGETGNYIVFGKAPEAEERLNSKASVQISYDERMASITLTPPKTGGLDMDIETMKTLLQEKGVVFGVDEEALGELFDNPIYGKPVTVAFCKEPMRGEDAVVTYGFETDRKTIKTETDNERIDYREMSVVQNVATDQVLATKKPATDGEEGLTVTNRPIPARPGKDTPLKRGRNTRFSEDKLQVLSDVDGRAMLQAGHVVVDPICNIDGDVNLKTGNIDFNGNVVIKGSVEDGFTVKALGEIKISGTVGAAVLQAGGDIQVHGGIVGSDTSRVKTDQNLFAKFIENAHIQTGGGVYASDGIMNSIIDSSEEVVCVQRRGAIIGGRIRAAKRVEAHQIGGVASPPTDIQVGIDPQDRQRLEETEATLEKAVKDLEVARVNLGTLKNQKKSIGKLPPDKAELLKNLIVLEKELEGLIARSEEEIETLKEHPEELAQAAKIIATKTAFAGVKLTIMHRSLPLTTEHEKTTFILTEDGVTPTPLSSDDIRTRGELASLGPKG